jgi:hypothetical protein
MASRIFRLTIRSIGARCPISENGVSRSLGNMQSPRWTASDRLRGAEPRLLGDLTHSVRISDRIAKRRNRPSKAHEVRHHIRRPFHTARPPFPTGTRGDPARRDPQGTLDKMPNRVDPLSLEVS